MSTEPTCPACSRFPLYENEKLCPACTTTAMLADEIADRQDFYIGGPDTPWDHAHIELDETTGIQSIEYCEAPHATEPASSLPADYTPPAALVAEIRRLAAGGAQGQAFMRIDEAGGR